MASFNLNIGSPLRGSFIDSKGGLVLVAISHQIGSFNTEMT